ncbi:MAG: chromosome segregation protein SMC [Verrucomicrobiota bacterium]
MYLQSLELIGFKSFAPKTTLRFHRGVTAIVGPNGCGKSNVLDAIRWVLGEQSAKALRGGEMADVIFNGTDTRQPHNMAEVSMTFDECEQELGVEWNEVRITRRVFRDGKSEYLINGTPCRLKDIHNLFMDTGIGRSAYSIMEQGRTAQLLNSRPEDRRAIFEEAAGITKYKAQKKEALRKLEYTESNLLRVSDIIKEVKRQIGSLQRQAGKARRYQSLMEDLRVLDTHLSHRTYLDLERSITEVAEQVEKSADARALYEREIGEQELEVAGAREQVTALDTETGVARDSLQTLRNRIFSGESRIETNAERCGEFREMGIRASADIDATHLRIREQENEIEQTDAQLTSLLEVLRGEEELLQAGAARLQQAQQERQSAEQATESLTVRLHGLENRLTDVRGELSTASARRDAERSRSLQLQEQVSVAGLAVTTAATRADQTGAAQASTRASLDAAEQELLAAQQGHDEAQNARQIAETEWNNSVKQLSEREHRLEILLQLEREGEGLGEGAQAILRGLDRPEFYQAGILGTLASLIEVPTAEIPAIEAALGAASRAIVFADAGMAEAALQTLREAAQGRASVVASDLLPISPSPAGALPEGATCWAVDVVRATGSAHGLIARLLEGVVIVPDLQTAFRLKKQYPGLAFAARTGEFIARDGVAHGGATGEATGSALLRRSQIASLEREVSVMRESVNHLSLVREGTLASLEAAVNRLRDAREFLGNTQGLLAAAQADNLLATRELESARNRHESLDGEISSLQEHILLLEAQMAEREQQLEKASLELNAAREERSAASSKISFLRDAETTAAAELAEARLRVATERQRQQSLANQRAPMEARVRELAETISARERDITTHDEKIRSLEAESTGLAESVEIWKTESAEAESRVLELSVRRAELQSGVEALEIALRGARKNLSDLQDNRSKNEVRLAELKLRAEAIRDHVSRRYQLDLAGFEPDRYALLKAVAQQKEKERRAALPQSTESTTESMGEVEMTVESVQSIQSVSGPIPAEIPWERIELVVAELTERADSMGPVNLDAIQEYDELEERYNFLEQQNNDLINGKAELMEAIARINKTTKVLFSETFEKIRVNFQEMFAQLFGGGKANLLLMDESDPLESGIEIIASPPGKKLQSISLLSGGERTMTAVALLFAIYMVKPSPFCVLDEMDAPLDESNIGRFIKLLDRFIGQSQFMVITHNKRTMSRADSLYGVTMEERGISKLLSVKFTGRDEQLPPAAESNSTLRDETQENITAATQA